MCMAVMAGDPIKDPERFKSKSQTWQRLKPSFFFYSWLSMTSLRDTIPNMGFSGMSTSCPTLHQSEALQAAFAAMGT